MTETTARGPRITAEPWQYLLGVGEALQDAAKIAEQAEEAGL